MERSAGESLSETERHAAFSVLPNAQNQTIGNLDVQAAGRDLINAQTVVNMVTNIAVQYAPRTVQQSATHEAGVGELGNRHQLEAESLPRQSSGFSIVDVCQAVSSVVTCWSEDGDSDSSVAVRSLDAAMDLPPPIGPTYAEVYVRGLLHSGHGLPCWEPAPHDSDDERRGVLPGDVGTYTVDRSFRKLFNLYDSEEDIRALAGVCSLGTYSPLHRQITNESMINQGETIVDGVSPDSPASVSSPNEVAIVHEFHYQSHPGAVLAATSPAELVSCNETTSMRNYIVQHAEAIYRHANSIRQIGDRESLYIISGSIKADTWAIASFRHQMQPPHNVLQLVRIPAPPNEVQTTTQSTSYQWTKQGHSARARLSNPAELGLKNQSLFLQGFKMALAPRFRARVKESALATEFESKFPGVVDEAEPPPDHNLTGDRAGERALSGASAEGEQSGGASFGNWTVTLDAVGSDYSANVPREPNPSQAGFEEDALYTPFPRIPETGYHPSDYINARVLQITSADVAICHDDNWRFLFRNCRSASTQASPIAVKSDSRAIYMQNGVAYVLPPDGADDIHEPKTASKAEEKSEAPNQGVLVRESLETISVQQGSNMQGQPMAVASIGIDPSVNPEKTIDRQDNDRELRGEEISNEPKFTRYPFDKDRTAHRRRPPQPFPRHSVCLPGTRKTLLQKLTSWATEPHPESMESASFSPSTESTSETEAIPIGKHLVWLCGPFGSGKSTIAQTVADTLQEKGLLAASYFFPDSTSPIQFDAEEFAGSLACQMAELIPEMRAAIDEHSRFTLPDSPLAHHAGLGALDYLMESLVYAPFSSAVKGGAYTFVVDWSGSHPASDDLRILLESFLDSSSRHPHALLRFIFSSRTRPGALPKSLFRCIHFENLVACRLERSQREDLEAVVRLTFERAFKWQTLLTINKDEWPFSEQAVHLVDLAEGSHEHMLVLLDWILEAGDLAMTRFRFRSLLEDGWTALGKDDPEKVLDHDYMNIVKVAKEEVTMQGWDGPVIEPRLVDIILVAIAFAEVPATVSALAERAGTTKAAVGRVLEIVQEVISTPLTPRGGVDDNGGSLFPEAIRDFIKYDRKISFFHSTFRDFIKDSKRSGCVIDSESQPIATRGTASASSGRRGSISSVDRRPDTYSRRFDR